MEEHVLKNVNSGWNIKISFYLETSGGQNSNMYSNVVHFLTPLLMDICGSLKRLFSNIGLLYEVFYYNSNIAL